jgi:hypothetical protein
MHPLKLVSGIQVAVVVITTNGVLAQYTITWP